ncbi:Crp/Fnr family transcriptional regulator [Streptosporangium carneum]|nr:Crp/Fnr family transcriptional regulator [Streptosporangium carneum]
MATHPSSESHGRQDRFLNRPWPPASLLGSIPFEDRRALLNLGALRQYGAGESLLVEGDTSTFVLLLLDGCVKITAVTENGRTALLAIRVGGDVIGELAAMDQAPRIATATAVGAVVANRIGAADLREFLTGHPATAIALGSVVAAKLRWATRRRVDFGGHEVKGRLARVLIELLGSYGKETREGFEITVSLTQPELAGIIGASEPAVHRALADLRHQGVVMTRYRKLLILDLDALTALAGAD